MKEIYLYSPIYDFVAEKLISSINSFEGEDIVMRVNSPGGSVLAGWGIIAKMIERKGKVTVKIDGGAMSMAGIISLFADRVEALDVSTIMLHRADMYISSPEDQTFLDKVNKDLRSKMEGKLDSDKLKEISGYSVKDLFESEKRIDLFLTAKQAKQIGLVDSINKVDPAEIKAFSEMFDVAAKHEPQAKPVIQNKMTKEKLLAEHPEVYAMIVGLGVAQERDRVGAWMKFNDVDPAAVSAGITSGENISQTAMADFAVKVYAKQNLAALGSESPVDLETKKAAEAAAKEAADKLAAEKEETPLAAFEKEVNGILNQGKTA